MSDSAKKISFGFSKSIKKPLFNGNTTTTTKKGKVELIDCLEGQSIKVKDPILVVNAPLVIPVGKSKTIADRIRETNAKNKSDDKGNVDLLQKPDSELSIDELAAKELLIAAQSLNAKGLGKSVLQLPTNPDERLVIEGKPEPTLEDYEAVPISEYGMAMLRGMGWKEGMPIGKNPKPVVMKEPVLRPRGLGLGANKLPIPTQTNDSHASTELVLKKGSFAKITSGKYNGYYCEVQGFDDEAGRIIVKLTVNGLILSLNEFIVVAVTRDEYTKNSKVINQLKYQEYKNKAVPVTSTGSEVIKTESGGRVREREKQSEKGRSSSEKRHARRKHKSKKSRHSSSSSNSDEDRRRRRSQSRD